MSSLHTKYRPITFDDVLGQDATVRSLKRTIKDARAHSFIFTGPAGTGKTTLARILAAHVGGSSSSSINIEEVDGASKSGADDMRELIIRTLYRAIGGSPVKFIVVDEAHRLSAAAWTVLLKPIEEPPPHVYYAFCTTDAAKIPKPIITRCQRYDLKPVKEELILELLVKVVDTEKFEVSDELLEAIAEACGGSPRQALVHLEACLGAKSIEEARSILRSASQSKEPVDLARLLIARQGANWAAALKIINSMEGFEAETVRIVVVNYLSGCLSKTKSEKEVKGLLQILDCFSKPYSTSDKFAPLFLSVGLALGLDQ